MTCYAPVEERAMYAQRVAQSLADYLRADEPIALHVADDGSPEPYCADLVAYADAIRDFGHFDHVSYSVSPRMGIGGSLNLAMQHIADDELFFYITDDWELTNYIDLSVPARLIRDLNYDYVRVGPIHPNLVCATRYEQGYDFWLELQPQYGGFCFATRPFLARKRFYDVVGPFEEYLDAYDTERLYAEKVKQEYSQVKLAHVGDLTGCFQHIGKFPVGKIQPPRPQTPA